MFFPSSSSRSANYAQNLTPKTAMGGISVFGGQCMAAYK